MYMCEKHIALPICEAKVQQNFVYMNLLGDK